MHLSFSLNELGRGIEIDLLHVMLGIHKSVPGRDETKLLFQVLFQWGESRASQSSLVTKKEN